MRLVVPQRQDLVLDDQVVDGDLLPAVDDERRVVEVHVDLRVAELPLHLIGDLVQRGVVAPVFLDCVLILPENRLRVLDVVGRHDLVALDGEPVEAAASILEHLVLVLDLAVAVAVQLLADAHRLLERRRLLLGAVHGHHSV